MNKVFEFFGSLDNRQFPLAIGFCFAFFWLMVFAVHRMGLIQHWW